MAKLGELELLVKFDTLGQSFKKAMKSAFQKVSVGAATEKKIDELRDIIKYKVDVPLTNLNTLIGKLQFLRTKEAKKKHVKQLKRGILEGQTGRKIIGYDEDLTDEEKKLAEKKAEQYAELLYSRYMKKLEADLRRGKLTQKSVDFQDWMSQVMKGNWKSMIKRLVEQLIPEEQLRKDIIKKWNEQFKGEMERGEVQYKRIKEKIGKGGKPIKDIAGLMEIITEKFRGLEGSKKERLKKLMQFLTTRPTESEATLEKGEDLAKIVEEIYEEYEIEKGMHVPPLLFEKAMKEKKYKKAGKLGGKEGMSAAARSIFFDLFTPILEEQIPTIKKWMEEEMGMSKKDIEDWDKIFDDIEDFDVLIGEVKSLAEELDLDLKEILGYAPFFAAATGGTAPKGVPKLYSPKLMEKYAKTNEELFGKIVEDATKTINENLVNAMKTQFGDVEGMTKVLENINDMMKKPEGSKIHTEQ